MRQIGVLAGAGLYALEHMVDRLAEDHANARTLAEGLAEIKGIQLDLWRVQTNLVIFEINGISTASFLDECQKRGLRADATSRNRVRFVTRYGIDAGDVQCALKVVSEVMGAA
jgi:threonine aldolase